MKHFGKRRTKRHRKGNKRRTKRVYKMRGGWGGMPTISTTNQILMKGGWGGMPSSNIV